MKKVVLDACCELSQCFSLYIKQLTNFFISNIIQPVIVRCSSARSHVSVALRILEPFNPGALSLKHCETVKCLKRVERTMSVRMHMRSVSCAILSLV